MFALHQISYFIFFEFEIKDSNSVLSDKIKYKITVKLCMQLLLWIYFFVITKSFQLSMNFSPCHLTLVFVFS